MPTAVEQMVLSRNLRSQTGLPLSRCITALKHTRYDFDTALSLLQTGGLDEAMLEEKVKRWVREEMRRQGVTLLYEQDPADAQAEDITITREDAIAIAKQQAMQHAADHEYLAHAADDPNWAPHEWVIQAIMETAAHGANQTPQVQPHPEPGAGRQGGNDPARR